MGTSLLSGSGIEILIPIDSLRSFIGTLIWRFIKFHSSYDEYETSVIALP